MRGRLSFDPGRLDEHARQVADALRSGTALVPALGGLVVLGRGPEPLASVFGSAFRVVTAGSGYTDRHGRTRALEDRVRRSLEGPAVGRLDVADRWAGLALATEPLLQATMRLVPDIGLGVPGEPVRATGPIGSEEPLLTLVPAGPVGPGPTVADFRTRPVTVERKGALAVLELQARLGDTVRLGPSLVFNVLVVCTGNMCRSPMAHGILARMLEGERVFVYSAGTDASEGMPATRAAVEAAAELGSDISGHRSRPLTAELVASADLVLVMEEFHRQRVLELAHDGACRVRLVGEYQSGAAPGSEIADPVGRPLEVYRRTAAGLVGALERVAAEVRARL